MKKVIINTCILGLSMSLAGCSTDSLLSNSNSSGETISSDLFNYSMAESVTFDVNYGSGFGGKTLLEVFTENPSGSNNEAIRSDLEPIYKVYTDANGKFCGDITLPTSVEKVWLVNRAFCLPMIVEADVSNGYVEYENDNNASSNNAKKVVSRAASDDIDSSYKPTKIAQASGDQGYWSITSMENTYGSVRNDALVSTNETLSNGTYSTYIRSLQNMLWNGNTAKPGNLDNRKYALGSDVINTNIKGYEYTDNEGKTHKVESADINIVFMTETGCYMSALGYYYYKTGTNPTANDVKKFVAIPNTSVAGSYPFDSSSEKSSAYTGNAPAYPGESVTLLFQKEDGTYTKHFPVGYTIGYFLLANSFYKGNVITTSGENCSYGKTKGPVFSNEAWNANSTKKFIAFSLPTGEIVYGLEDGGDNSYEDNLFIVQGTPNETIENPDLPVISPDDGTIDGKIIEVTESATNTYAFEDKFPYSKGCDYDMNDVIVTHKRTVVFDKTNGLDKVTDTYTFDKNSDLSYVDGFAVQMNPKYIGSLTITDGNGYDITSSVKMYNDGEHNDWNTCVLCENVKANLGKTFTVTRVFNGGYSKEDFDKDETIADVNPFVISQFTEDAYNSGTLTEVHFAGNNPMTSKGDSQYDQKGNQYYIGLTGDNQYFPYALSIPQASFEAPASAQRIDMKYSKYSAWAKSKGENNKDWYKYPDQ